MPSIFEKLQEIDSRIIFWISLVAIIVPLLNPLGLPLPISDYTRDLYDFVNDLPEGSVIGVAMDTSVGQWPALEPGWVAFLKMAFENNLKLIVWSMDSTGPRCWDFALMEMPRYIEDKVYGVDYVTFDYIPGVESAVASLASDTIATLGNDRYGTPAAEIPMMADIKSANDFDALWVYEQGVGTTTAYLRHWASGYDVPFILGSSPAGLMNYVPYYGREVKGMLAGGLGAAELELLIRSPAKGLQMMDAQNLMHLVIILYLIVGNAAYWITRFTGKEEVEDTVNPMGENVSGGTV